MMSCYAWGEVGKSCYESHLRTANKTCKRLKCQTTSMQIVKYEGTQVTQEKPLEFKPAWGLGITLLKLVGSTCPIRSNRVLRVPISLVCFLGHCFSASLFNGNRNIPKNQTSTSVVSSIYQLRTTPKPVISLRPNGQVGQVKILEVS